MTHHTADVVICGAGIAGISAAFSLARYADPAYRKRLRDWGPTGQL